MFVKIDHAVEAVQRSKAVGFESSPEPTVRPLLWCQSVYKDVIVSTSNLNLPQSLHLG